jgi:hypothetical protein
MRFGWLGLVVLLTGCPTGGGAIPTRDSGPRRDSGHPVDASGLDAGAQEDDAGAQDDASTLDAGAVDDAGPIEVDAGHDAGTFDGGGGDAPPVIDGIVSDAEWAGATAVASSEPTIWTGNELRRMRALLREDGLYVAIEGVVEAGNGMMLYVDRARGSSEGVSLADVTDFMGALDNAITPGVATPITTPSDVRVDLGWGSLDLSRTASASDDRMGWRDFVRAGSPADLFWILGTDAPTTCGADACETFLPRAVLDMGPGAARPRTVALFARINQGNGEGSPNQTLPPDDPSAPRTVSVVLELTE